MVALALALSTHAHAHGLWGHIHVTGWAVENMPDDELRAFLLEPEVFNALLFGATFTDTGYAMDVEASRAYAEHTHWEPFIQDYVEWMRVNDPPPWTTTESKQRVAFLMGCASHGLQDELFDTLFLYQVNRHDGREQGEADPGTDGFLALDEHLRFMPKEWIPLETVLELYAELPQTITEDVIADAVGLVTAFYINDTIGPGVARSLGETYDDIIPWTREHYLDTEIPGSLRSEIVPTMRYQQAIWARLHEGITADEAAVFAYPESPRRLLAADATSPDSWVTVVFGVGVRYTDDLLTLVDANGAVVATTAANSRWGPEYTRVARLAPLADLTPGAWYTVRARTGLETIDGQASTRRFEHTFQVPCEPDATDACEDLGDLTEPSIDGVPAPPAPDASADADDKSDPGCGCGATSQAGWIAPLAALGLVRRRRRVSRFVNPS